MSRVRQVILQNKNLSVKFIEPWAFMLRTDRPFVWLQKICLFILRKIKAFRESEREHLYCNEISFETGDFMADLFDSKRAIDCEFNRRPQTLLIGRKEMNDFLGSSHVRDTMRFDTQYYLRDSNDYQGRPHYNIHGLEVHVIPWMEGMLLLQGKYNPDSKER